MADPMEGLSCHEENASSFVWMETPRDFSFNEILTYLTRSPNESLYRVEEQTIDKLVSFNGQRVFLSIDCPALETLRVSVVGEGNQPVFDEAVRSQAVEYVRNWFDLDRDLTPFYQMAQEDPLLAGPARQFYGLRIVGVDNLFEAFAWAIIGQQINLTFAYTLKRRLVETFGTPVERDNLVYWLFPSPDKIASLSPSDVTVLQFSQKKAEYLIEIASRIATGELTKAKLLALPDFSTIEKELVGIRGIGPWTANYVAMRCLRIPRAFPITDVGLHNAVKLQLGLDRKPTLEELAQMASRWSGWEAYATFYLWRSLQGLSA